MPSDNSLSAHEHQVVRNGVRAVEHRPVAVVVMHHALYCGGAVHQPARDLAAGVGRVRERPSAVDNGKPFEHFLLPLRPLGRRQHVRRPAGTARSALGNGGALSGDRYDHRWKLSDAQQHPGGWDQVHPHNSAGPDCAARPQSRLRGCFAAAPTDGASTSPAAIPVSVRGRRPCCGCGAEAARGRALHCLLARPGSGLFGLALCDHCWAVGCMTSSAPTLCRSLGGRRAPTTTGTHYRV